MELSNDELRKLAILEKVLVHDLGKSINVICRGFDADQTAYSVKFSFLGCKWLSIDFHDNNVSNFAPGDDLAGIETGEPNYISPARFTGFVVEISILYNTVLTEQIQG